MLASILIIGVSAALLVYWFRYSCMLLLRNYADQLSAATSVAEGGFQVADVREALRNDQQLDPVHQSLQRDYRVLVYLVEHASGLGLETLEDRLLVLDFKVMHYWYQLTRTAFPQQARSALSEMASVLEVLAGKIGQRAVHAEA